MRDGRRGRFGDEGDDVELPLPAARLFVSVYILTGLAGAQDAFDGFGRRLGRPWDVC